MLSRCRGIALATSVCAVLVFVNACESESDASNVFRSAQYVESDLDGVLSARHADQVTHMQIERGCLIVGSFGVVAALASKKR